MDDDRITDRLRDLGRQPVDPATASAHLTAMGSVRRRPRLGTRAKVGGAFFAGLLVGGTGLAGAGALPSSVQNAAHTTLAQVGVSVPDGHGPVRSTVGCGGVTYKNHGQFVKAQQDKTAAAASPCGQPVQAVTGGRGASGDQPGVTGAPEPTEAPEAPEAPEPTDAPDTGKPASPGNSGKAHGKSAGKGASAGQGQDSQGQDSQGQAPATPKSPGAPVAPSTTTTSTPASPSTTSAPATTSTTR